MTMVFNWPLAVFGSVLAVSMVWLCIALIRRS